MKPRAWNSTLPQRSRPLTATTGLRPGGGLARPAGLAARSTLGRGSPIAPVSAKRQRENRERARMAGALHPGGRGDGQDRPLCDVTQARATAGLPPLDGCTRWADNLHEPLRRSQGGSITDPANSRPACQFCNGHLALTPRTELGWAYELGLVRDRAPRGGEAA
jgi:hypothetical protein